jgi:hypothetical protein
VVWKSALEKNPPMKHLFRIVEKILTDEAKGIIVFQIRYRANWFTSLMYIAISWFDIPLNEVVFEDPFGNPIKSGEEFRFRVIQVDAHGIRQEVTTKSYRGLGRDPLTLSVMECLVQQACEHIAHHTVVRSAIESASPPPRAKVLEAELRKKLDDVMEHPVYARDATALHPP